MRKVLLYSLPLLAAGISSCGGRGTGDNPAAFISDPDKLEMIYSIKDLDNGGGRFYEMDYTADYKLDKMLEAQVVDAGGLKSFLGANLFDKVQTEEVETGYGAGCSAFAAPEKSGRDFLMGRNFDYCHLDPQTGTEAPIAAIMVRTAPKGGKKSISMVDSFWLRLRKGFFTDGVSDLSIAMAFPYALMDGINEDGFAIGVLHLGGPAAVQNGEGRRTITTSVAMRMLLDRASTVEEAVEMLGEYNMYMDSPASGSFHFFMADATGDYAIVEYIYDSEDYIGRPCKMRILKDNDSYRYVTNFYVSPEMAGHPDGATSDRGKWRYERMRDTLAANGYCLTEAQAMGLLGAVATDVNIAEPTSHTQWSSLYNLSRKTLDISILKEYGKVTHFKVK